MSDTEQAELERLTEEARNNLNRARLEFVWAKRMNDPDYSGWYKNQIASYRKQHKPEFFAELVEEKRKAYNKALYAYVKARMNSDPEYKAKILEFRRKANEKTAARLKELYHTDPEYHKKVLAKSKAYKRTRPRTPEEREKNRQRCAAYNAKKRLERLAMKEGLQTDEEKCNCNH